MEGQSADSVRPPAEGPAARTEGTPAEGPTTTGNALPELTSLTEMIRVMIEDRERREKEIAQERERRDRELAEDRRRQMEENERRIQEMRRQMEYLERLVTERTTLETTRRSADAESVKLTRLGESDDVEAYLTTFERIMEVNEIDRGRWPFQLAPQLTGKAQQAYAALAPEDAKDYDTVKTAILRRYNINEETYRQRFRALKPREDESPRELITRLQDLASRWTRDASTHQELLDLLVREQFLQILPQDVRVAVMEKQPKDAEEASRYAESYLQAREISMVVGNSKTPMMKENSGDITSRPNQERRGAGYIPQLRRQDHNQPRDIRSRNTDRDVRCFTCNQKGHLAFQCPQRASLFCDTPGSEKKEKQSSIWEGAINGSPCTILLDTGTTQSLVRSDYVEDDDLLDGSVPIRCMHGDVKNYPVAPIAVDIDGTKAIVHAAVSPNLPQPAVIGWDAPTLLRQLFVQKDGQLSKRVGIGPVRETIPTALPQEKEGGV